jgi:phosphopantothenoylcysteine decarboxylase / phosphopantothenate---cysteine ligase
MGYALARAARRRGARVLLVSGPTQQPAPAGCELTRVETTLEMLAACQQLIGAATVLLMAAAPADYRPKTAAKAKLKKEDAGQSLTVELEGTPDILRTLKARQRGIITVGFAAETSELETHAKEKIARKDLDIIVANDITRPDAGFAVDTNAVVIIDRDGNAESLPTMNKDAVAGGVLDRVARLMTART